MNQINSSSSNLQEGNSKQDDDDEHENEMVMPGFRFHPTEEELVEFYLRRKVQGKRFNVELITFLDLYHYDPWELPALAAIGEKEWYFYVPRDRKYRNGDRPNRVTTSGYWKATGADRMIRSENLRSIGLKKTLVFYSGKAPKGIRTSWIMNEYRLPHHETERLQKAEISLCRVYKRAGMEDHPSLPPRSTRMRQPSTSQKHATDHHQVMEMSSNGYGGSPQQTGETASPSSSADIGTHVNHPLVSPPDNDDQGMMILHQYSKQSCNNTIFSTSSDDLHKLFDIYSNPQQQIIHGNHQYSPNSDQNLNLLSDGLHPQGSIQVAFPNRFWDYTNL